MNNNAEENSLAKPLPNYDSYFINENLRFDCKFEQYYPSIVSLMFSLKKKKKT